MDYNTQTINEQNSVSLFNSFMIKVYMTMGLGLLVTALVATISYFTGIYYTFMQATGNWGYLIVAGVELAVVIVLTLKLQDLSMSAANLLFYVYAGLTGFTFTALLYSFDIGIIGIAFALTSVLFFSCAIFGRLTNMDMSRLAPLLFGGMIALLVTSIASWFIPAVRDSLIPSYGGIVLFMLYTMYDVQKLKAFYLATNSDVEAQGKLVIDGALDLYLDFINLFIRVLEILGSSKNKN